MWVECEDCDLVNLARMDAVTLTKSPGEGGDEYAVRAEYGDMSSRQIMVGDQDYCVAVLSEIACALEAGKAYVNPIEAACAKRKKK